MDVEKTGWIEIDDYERLLILVGFDPPQSPVVGGRRKITDPNFDNLLLLAPTVSFEEFFDVLVMNDFPERERPPDTEMTEARKFDEAAKRRQERMNELNYTKEKIKKSCRAKKERRKKCCCVVS